MRATTAIFSILLLAAGAAVAQDADGLGKTVYTKYCEQCHGADGDGEGVAAVYVKPKPRDFTKGKYKVRSTLTGQLPTDDDLKRAVQRGLPYTAMTPFSNLTDAELDAVVQYVKTFSPDFADPELTPEPLTIPTPPPYDEEAAKTTGKQIYKDTGCAPCHGNFGRGDGNSAPTLVDDWGDHVRIADLTMPWTFRGGGTREDIYRTMSTGFFGTPMPGFYGNLTTTETAEASAEAKLQESDQRMWAIVDYMYYLAGGPDKVDAPYENLVNAVGTDEELDLARGKELFANAPRTMFPLAGQVIEPGRNFYPSVYAINVQAVYNDDEVAFLLTWNDMRAETTGTNAPDLTVPLWLDELGPSAADEEEDIWGGGAEDEEDIWGDAAEEEGGEEDIWGDAAEEEGGEDDFWGEEEDAAAAAPAGPTTEFNDAVAIQLPLTMPQGIRRPYFIFGDAQNPVDIWFRDLGADGAAAYVGRGSAAMAPADGEAPETWARYEEGEWAVIFKRKRKSRAGISFEEDAFVPIAFSVWDGFNRERGNKRALTVWRYVYMTPREEPQWQGPVARAFVGILILELVLIALVRRAKRKEEGAAEGAVEPASA